MATFPVMSRIRFDSPVRAASCCTTYTYTDDDKLAKVTEGGRTVTTGYDGLGRALTTTTRSLLILGQTTTQVWDGLEVVQRDHRAPLLAALARAVVAGLVDNVVATMATAPGEEIGDLYAVDGFTVVEVSS